MRVSDNVIQTREVLDYEGIHLFHYATSSCSQKTRIVLNLKKIDWHPHLTDLSIAENNEDWFLGINPRGLVPVLVVDGAVHIESNDILFELERLAPTPPLFPENQREEINKHLAQEDDLHIDLRTLSFRFVFNRTQSTKPPEALARYREHGDGLADPKKRKEVAFYDRIAETGLVRDILCAAAGRFRTAFDDWEVALSNQSYLLGEDLTVIDIAWYVYTKRLRFAGYPMRQLHPGIEDWFLRLDAQSDFTDGIGITPELEAMIAANRQVQEETGTTMSEIVGWS